MNPKHLNRHVPLMLGLFMGLLILLLAPGCAVGPEGSYKFGKASENLFAAQVVNWAAPNDPSPVQGMPGTMSEMIFVNRYMKEIVAEKDEEEESDITGRFNFSQ